MTTPKRVRIRAHDLDVVVDHNFPISIAEVGGEAKEYVVSRVPAAPRAAKTVWVARASWARPEAEVRIYESDVEQNARDVASGFISNGAISVTIIPEERNV